MGSLRSRTKDLEEYAKKFAEEEAADTKARQIRYELYPSKQYVLYLAKKNAIKTWTSDGPDGKNRGCLEVQIAIATEKIRNMILHMREFRKDYRCRLKLTSLVCARRRMLDKLASKNLNSYMKIREELKIRHVYRIEALKNRLGAYMYPIKDRSNWFHKNRWRTSFWGTWASWIATPGSSHYIPILLVSHFTIHIVLII